MPLVSLFVKRAVYERFGGIMALGTKQALSIVFHAADEYRDNLANRSVLFLSVDKQLNVRCMEAAFDESNFNHLTGMKTKLSPSHFFSKCLDRRLSERDFWLASDGTTELKLTVLQQVVKSDLSARMIGRYNESRPKLYTEVLAGGVSASLGFIRDGGSGMYVPNTLLNEDVRSLTTGKPDRIVLTLRKDRADEEYAEVVYVAKNVDWERVELPEAIRHIQIPGR